MSPDREPVVRLTPGARLDIQRVGGDRIVEVDGRPGLFTPFVGADPGDVASTTNLQKVVDVLRQQVGQLQTENAALVSRLAEIESPARSSDDFAAGLQHSLDVLQERLATMDNPVSSFAVREFALDTRVHVDVTPLGTVGFRFVQPGEEVDAASLSTLSVKVVPVPKPSAEADAMPAGGGHDVGVEAIDGLSAAQVAGLRSAHVGTAAAFLRIATRASATARLVSLLGVDRDALGRYALLAGLLAVPGLDRLKAAVLYDAGIRDVASLAAAEPADLARRYARAVKRRDDDDGFRPTKAQAAAWVAAASRMTDRG